ncbi:hypothetical protein [Rhodococcoides fascians]|uniref:hypothetical protein n=1 Tax=Rhodococcoides fascians TaxID=1828 RepID=UPI00050C4757|nr:hypothetical protein [Rhodococcus fascians]
MGFDRAKRDIVAEAYRRTSGQVAYLDESYQAPDPTVTMSNTFYIFTAVIVHKDAMGELRRDLGDIVDGTWWHTTDALLEEDGRVKTRRMLEYLGEGFEACVIAHKVPVNKDDHDAEEARRACYRALAIELAAGATGRWEPVELLVLEERNQMNFRNKDRLNHKELVAEKKVPRNARLLQTSPRFERLLWLPDVVSAAYRRTLTHSDETSTMFDLIKKQVHFVDVTE